MAPLSQEVQSVSSCSPPHLGPAIAEMNSIWFKLWLYKKLGSGPPSLLLAKGNRLRKLPALIKVKITVILNDDFCTHTHTHTLSIPDNVYWFMTIDPNYVHEFYIVTFNCQLEIQLFYKNVFPRLY